MATSDRVSANQTVFYTPITLLSPYTFLYDSFYGEGGYRYSFYLVPHLRETPEQYSRRGALSYYPNYVKPALNSHVNPIWRIPPTRTFQANVLFDGFLKDVDLRGTGIDKFMKRSGRRSKLDAVSFVVIDNFSDVPDNLEAQLDARAFPYGFIVTADRVVGWTVDKFGRLVSISYDEPADEIKKGETPKKYVRTWTASSWSLKEGEKIIREGEHNLGKLPVIPFYAFDNDTDDVLPLSEFYDVARTNFRIFNLCSEITEVERNQTFSILTIPGKPEQLAIGSANAIGYDPKLTGGAKPEFISPDAGQLKALREDRQELTAEVYRQAMLTHVHKGEAQSQSGTAKKWDFEITSQALADFAHNAEEVERRIAEIFGLWIDVNLDFKVEYQKKYGLADIAEELDNALKATALDFGEDGNANVKKRVSGLMFSGDPDAQKENEESIDAVKDDETFADIEGDGDGDDEIIAVDVNEEARAKLRGSVGGVQGILDVQRGVAEGITPYESAVEILVQIFGFEDAKARRVLGPKKSIKKTDGDNEG